MILGLAPHEQSLQILRWRIAKAPHNADNAPTTETGNGATEHQKAPAASDAIPNATASHLNPKTENIRAAGPESAVARNINATISAREAMGTSLFPPKVSMIAAALWQRSFAPKGSVRTRFSTF